MTRSPTARLRDSIRTVNDFPRAGIQFKDITPLLADADLVREAIELLVSPFAASGITKVAAIESRGFILGAMILSTGRIASKYTAMPSLKETLY